MDQEIKKLEEELNRLKNSNITERVKAETVELPVTTVDDSSSADEKVDSEPDTVYLCPTCAYQLLPPRFECEYCNK